MQSRVLGFTIIELLVVVAIVGILSAIGYPSYQQYAREARRTDATSALLSMANEQEKRFLGNNQYSSTTAEVWFNGTASNEGFYTVEARATKLDGTAVDLTAEFLVRATVTAGGPQATDTDCAVFELDQAGTRIARNSVGTDNSAECW